MCLTVYSAKLQVRTVLDIGCGFGSFGSHLLSLNIMAVCVASYELMGSQVQLALERGLPAIIGNFISRQLPFPSLAYDMIHCSQCGIVWDDKGNAATWNFLLVTWQDLCNVWVNFHLFGRLCFFCHLS